MALYAGELWAGRAGRLAQGDGQGVGVESGREAGRAAPPRWWIAVLVISFLTSFAGVRAPWLYHAWKGTELDTFDFLLASKDEANPFVALKRRVEPVQEEVDRLVADVRAGRRDPGALMRLAFLHYQSQRPGEALGYLQLLDELRARGDSSQEARTAACYQAHVFSEHGLKMPEIEQRFRAKCPESVAR